MGSQRALSPRPRRGEAAARGWAVLAEARGLSPLLRVNVCHASSPCLSMERGPPDALDVRNGETRFGRDDATRMDSIRSASPWNVVTVLLLPEPTAERRETPKFLTMWSLFACRSGMACGALAAVGAVSCVVSVTVCPLCPVVCSDVWDAMLHTQLFWLVPYRKCGNVHSHSGLCGSRCSLYL